MPVSEKQGKSRDKHDKENFQYITFKARKGSKERIVEAAQSKDMSTNGFIREAVNKAVLDTTGLPMEDVPEK